MKKSIRILMVLLLVMLLVSMLCVPAFAITESEVEAQVAASSKGAVTGSVLLWFLCAIAFLKVSQKIDSIMASMGINAGHTGGSMLAEAMIAMRAITMVVGGRHGGGSAAGAAAGKTGGSAGMAGFFKGGLIGMAGRHITNSAVKTATTQTSAVHTASQARQAAAATTAAAQTGGDSHINSEIHTGGSSIYTENGVPGGAPPQEGVIVTGGPSPQVPPVENAPVAEGIPSVSSAPDHMPPQEGVILAGSEAPISTPVADQAPPESIPADMTPPQEGVVLTGSEAPPSIPATDQAPPESIPADMTPPQEGVIITEGGTTVHAPQTADTPHSSPVSPPPQETAAHPSGGQHTERRSERATQTAQTRTSSDKVQTNRFHSSGVGRPTLGGMVFSHSLQSGGSFANDVIGTVARGEVAGSITGDLAAQSMASNIGAAPTGIGSREAPVYSDVEIGWGRITGVETPAGESESWPFAMYHMEQYTAPSGDFTKVVSADGAQWYKQYAQDAVERKPYMAPDDTVAYHERIVKKLPNAPKRKDRM